jgi:2-oxo-3-hexenedioate decarboxylase/2-keto-4-pentenoate hydratase
MNRDEVVSALAEGRTSGGKMKAYPGDTPKDMAEAFAIQTAVREKTGWTHAGWKMGCTSKRVQEALGTDRPFPGPVYRERLFRSGVHLETRPENFRTTEPEVAFTMARDLPKRDRPYTADEVMAAVKSVHAAIEIVNPRLPKGFEDSILWYVADGGLNDSLIINDGIPPLPREKYAGLTCRVSVNGVQTCTGEGHLAAGGADLALTWLANDLIEKGQHLKAGEVITTGLITPIFFGKIGDVVEVDYDLIGKVSVRF